MGDSLENAGKGNFQKQTAGLPSFDEIYREHGDRVLNLLYRFTTREQVARDLLQDVFVKVYENMGSFEHRSQIYTWIYRIAVNHALNYLRRERRTLWVDLMDEKVADLLSHEKIDIPGVSPHAVDRPDEALERGEMSKLIQDAVNALHPKYRVPFVLFRDEQFSYAEIATTLGLSLSAVESRIHRARKMLIRKLNPLLK